MSDIEKTRQETLQMIEQCTREMQEAMRAEKPDLAAAFGAMGTTAGMAFLLGLHKPSAPATVSTCDDYPECERDRDRMRARIAELEAAQGEPVAWCVTWDGGVTANVHLTRASAESSMRRLKEDHPGPKRTVVPLYAAQPPSTAVHNGACSNDRGGECDCWYLQPSAEPSDALVRAAKDAIVTLNQAKDYTSTEAWSPSMTRACQQTVNDLRRALATRNAPATKGETT